MNIRRWSITVGFCLFIFALLAAYKFQEIKAAIAMGESFPEHSESVEISIAQTREHVASIKTLGEVIAPQYLDLRNELPGRITKVNFQSGQTVKKDQLLIQLDISEENSRLDAARARAHLMNTLYKRAIDLRKTNAVSEEQLDRSKADLAMQKADVQALISNIRKKSILAPFDGVTGIHQFEIGQVLEKNTLITTLIGQQDYMWVDFSVPQFYPTLISGTQVKIKTIGNMQLNNDVSSEPILAEVFAQNTVINANSRSRQYRARVNTLNKFFTSNAAVELQIPVSAPQTLVAVAATAIQHDLLGQYVYVLEKDKKQDKGFRAKRQQVKVAGSQGDLVLLSEGLEAGTQIAGAGAFKLHPGLLVYANTRPVRNAEPTNTKQTNDNDIIQGKK